MTALFTLSIGKYAITDHLDHCDHLQPPIATQHDVLDAERATAPASRSLSLTMMNIPACPKVIAVIEVIGDRGDRIVRYLPSSVSMELRCATHGPFLWLPTSRCFLEERPVRSRRMTRGRVRAGCWQA